MKIWRMRSAVAPSKAGMVTVLDGAHLLGAAVAPARLGAAVLEQHHPGGHVAGVGRLNVGRAASFGCCGRPVRRRGVIRCGGRVVCGGARVGRGAGAAASGSSTSASAAPPE
jgi:hypothetical protein